MPGHEDRDRAEREHEPAKPAGIFLDEVNPAFGRAKGDAVEDQKRLKFGFDDEQSGNTRPQAKRLSMHRASRGIARFADERTWLPVN